MEPTRVHGTLEAVPAMHEGDVSELGYEACALTQSTVKVEDIDLKGVQWNLSPERPASLLPAFSTNQPSHLPTPQSPGNLAGYLPRPIESPLSSEHVRAGQLRQFTASRPPSRPASAHPPTTPQRRSLSAPRPLRSLPATPDVDHEHNSLFPRSGETNSMRQNPSQIATPSPEVTRTRRASVPNTPSDSETMLSTPRIEKRSSSHPYVVPTTLAPALIISPANSNHSTVCHASPEFDRLDIQAGRSYKFSHSMTSLVSQNDIHAVAHHVESYDLSDPFIVGPGEDRDGRFSGDRYPSPPLPKHRLLATVHEIGSHLLGACATEGIASESVSGVAPSSSESFMPHHSPVKNETEDEEDRILTDSTFSLVIDEPAFPRAPSSPHTPPPVTSHGGPETRTPTLEDSVFRTPPRAVGGEIERIRQRQADLKEACTVESEKRRPEYLVRTKRARDAADEEAAERERESMLPGLGVTVSPVKGRRLKLYRPVAVDSDAALDEERTSGNDGIMEPKTPPPLNTLPSASNPAWQPAVPVMSLRAINWRTPGRRGSSPVAWTEENEIKKQKRLAAFASAPGSSRGNCLRPVEVPGQGRIIIDVTSEEMQHLAQAGAFELPKADSHEDAEIPVANLGAEWPDDEYPWSLQERQRDEYEAAERGRRLRWIERFLDRESESEDDDNHDCAAGPSTWNQTGDSVLSHLERGRGKTVSLNATPGIRRSKSGGNMTFGTANADAREVLMSKKHVREVAERIRRRKAAEEEEGVVMCICQGADDGRPMVRCDECRTWYHLVCMDIQDESELGDEWFCWKCVRTAEDPPPAPLSEPTFAPVMPDSPPRAGVGDLPLYQSALQPSPMLDIRTRAPTSPATLRKREHSPPRRTRLPHSSLGDPDDPVRGGPSTPYHPRSGDSRLYSTPKFYDEYIVDEHAPFDPTSTPSRGLKFPNPMPITPRRPQTWTPAQGLPWATPAGLPRTPQFSSQTGSSSTRSLAYSLSTLDDSGGPLTSPWPTESPVRRALKPGESTWPYPPSRRVPDSPLAMRGTAHRPFSHGVEESPTPRHFPRGKDRDIGELSSRVGQGQSPHHE